MEREVPAQKLPGTTGKALAIVLIKVAVAVLANVDTQGKRTNGCFVCALGEGSDR
jgi:hypothetical protein